MKQYKTRLVLCYYSNDTLCATFKDTPQLTNDQLFKSRLVHSSHTFF